MPTFLCEVVRMVGDSDPVLGTQEMSRILRCAPRTVAKLIDTGQLSGFKVPGSKTRRVLRSEFVRFCRAANMPAVIVCGAERARRDDDDDPDLAGHPAELIPPLDGHPLACAATFLPEDMAGL
jgi:hypothetical protein